MRLRPLAATAAVLFMTAVCAQAQSGLRIEATVPGTAPLNGHLILAISTDASEEPRFQISGTYTSQQAFGVDVENLAPGKPIVVDEQTVGYPLEHLSQIKPGDYYVQAVFNIYEQYHLANGHTVWLAPDRGEGQHWQIKPGNPYSAVAKLHIDPLHLNSKAGGVLKLTLDKTIPPIDQEQVQVDQTDNWFPLTEPQLQPQSKWLKRIQIHSDKLSKFWGRDVSIGAIVLLPDGFDEHPDAHYPVIVWQDHFHRDFYTTVAFRSTPPTPNLTGYERTYAEYSYKFFQDWTSGRLPRVIIVALQHANPYYDDSYAVNSANLGPYGDAIHEEILPEIERRYRGMGAGWARATYGGSTGGWEAAAAQIFYPDFYNGAWANCPDPVDFHAYQNVNLYEDTNAFYRQGPFGKIDIPAERQVSGAITAQNEPQNRYEYVLGTHGRSGEQWDIWQAVFSPAGDDGYPRPIFDKRTGAIDKDVVAYWHDHYDLNAILKRDWTTLGPKLEGKLHFAVGEADTYFLNNAVHLMQKSLDETRSPHSDATFDYGPLMPHCYSGDPTVSTRISRLTINQRVLPLMVDHMLKTAPAGADVSSWRY